MSPKPTTFFKLFVTLACFALTTAQLCSDLTNVVANSVFEGDICSAAAFTSGANTFIHGSIQAKGAITLGAQSHVSGSVYSDVGVITYGAGSTVGIHDIYSLAIELSAMGCPVGNAGPGCTPCPVGSYSLAQASQCTSCPIGQTCPIASVGPDACHPVASAAHELHSSISLIASVPLGSAANFVILTKTGTTTTGPTVIVGNVASSPIASTANTGFSLSMDASNTFSTSPVIVGRLYAAEYAPPTPSALISAVSDMQTAYANAGSRVNPNFINLAAGNPSGKTLVSGLYQWTTGVLINDAVTIYGGQDEVFIFQIAGTLNLGTAAKVILSGGVRASNIFWQVAGATTFGTTSHFEGILLCATSISVQTGASVNGRLFAQTGVTLDSNAIKQV